MKATGIVRKLDALGRVVLPKELRRTMDLKEGDPMEVFVDGDNIILSKYMPSCIFCNSAQDTIDYKGKKICKKCSVDFFNNVWNEVKTR